MPGKIARELFKKAGNPKYSARDRAEAAGYATLYFMVNGEHEKAAKSFLAERRAVQKMNPGNVALKRAYHELHEPLAGFMEEHGARITVALHELGRGLDLRLSPSQRYWLAKFLEHAGRDPYKAAVTHENFREPPAEVGELIDEEWENAFGKAGRFFTDDEQSALSFMLHVRGGQDLNFLHALALKGILKTR